MSRVKNLEDFLIKGKHILTNKHVHESKHDEILTAYIDQHGHTNISGLKKFISIYLDIKNASSNGYMFWIVRGWSELEARTKQMEKNKNKKKGYSPFSREFWMAKGYSIEKADYMRNSRRPIRKEYWMERGYDESSATEKASETKRNNNNKGSSIRVEKLTPYDNPLRVH